MIEARELLNLGNQASYCYAKPNELAHPCIRPYTLDFLIPFALHLIAKSHSKQDAS